MRFLRYLQKQTETNPDLSWHQWGKCKGRCSIEITINNWEDIKNAFQKLIMFFDPLLTDCIDKFNLHRKNEISSPYTRELEFKELTNSQEKVVLETKICKIYFLPIWLFPIISEPIAGKIKMLQTVGIIYLKCLATVTII